MSSSRPLIEYVEGHEQDDRNAITSAWRRVQFQRNRPANITDLHVREFIYMVFALDHRGDGYQVSYEELALKLECKVRTARDIVKRATEEFRFVIASEDRYVTSGQKANRYSIDFDFIRAINRGEAKITIRPKAGDVTRQPPDVTRQPPDVTRQPPDVTRHPYKETPSIHSSTSPKEPPLQATSDRTAHGGDPWVVVESSLEALGMGNYRNAALRARSRGMSPQEVLDWVQRFGQLTAANPEIHAGYLHKWLFGQGKPPWLQPSAPVQPVTRASLLSSAESQKLTLQTKIGNRRRELAKLRVPLPERDAIIAREFGKEADARASPVGA